MGNFYLVVIDGLGVGAQEDSALYGDEHENTLGHLCEATECPLPNLGRLGLGNIIPLASVPSEPQPLAAHGKMREVSVGKDSTTGHWELAGVQLSEPFPVYPEGFPDDIIQRFREGIGVETVLCNKPYSGTQVISDFGRDHLSTGHPIVYTSADSVFQIAAHTSVTPVEKLYEWCRFAREKVLTGGHGVGRVIARPFDGDSGRFKRISDQRKDFSLPPPDHNLVSVLLRNGVKCYAIGKIADLFAGIAFTQYRRTKSNAEGIAQLLSLMSAVRNSFVFVNLIDTDQLYGHRLDPDGYARCMQEIDRAIPAILGKLQVDDVLVITGDHGNDPTSTSTDHSREFVPLLVYPHQQAVERNLGIRGTFSDVAASAAKFFGISETFPGKTFL